METLREKLIKKHKKLKIELSKLEYSINKYFRPIINDLSEKNDIQGLKKLLDLVPTDSYIKLSIYQAIREITDKINN